MVHDVIPDGAEVLHQLRLACLGIEVGNTGIEVVGTDRMAHSLVLVAKLMTVLVVVLAVLYGVADGYETFGQREVFLVARLTIHLGSTHIVAGTDGVARQLGGIVGEKVVEEVGSLLATVEEGSLARGTLVDDTGGHEVAEVVGLEVQARGKGVLLVLANLDTGSVLAVAVGVDARIALGDDHGGVDIAVGTLGQGYLLDELVHEGVNLRVFGNGIDSGTGFEPLIHVAIVEGRAVVLALNGTCSHLEIGKAVGTMQT